MHQCLWDSSYSCQYIYVYVKFLSTNRNNSKNVSIVQYTMNGVPVYGLVVSIMPQWIEDNIKTYLYIR